MKCTICLSQFDVQVKRNKKRLKLCFDCYADFFPGTMASGFKLERDSLNHYIDHKHLRDRKTEDKRFAQKQIRRVKRGGLFALHAAGSKGLFDVVMLGKNHVLRCISCKCDGYIDPKEREALNEFLKSKPKWAQVEIHFYKSKKKFKKKIIKRSSDLERFGTRKSKGK